MNERTSLSTDAPRNLPEGISQCAQRGGFGGFHVYMAGPCFDSLDQALAYKASLDAQGVKWRPQT